MAVFPGSPLRGSFEAGALNDLVTFGVFFAVLSYVAYTDVKERRVPNAAVAVAFAAGFYLNREIPADALWGILACSFVLCVPYFSGLIGAGDVKLGAAVGAAMRPEKGVLVMIVSSALAALCSLTVIMKTKGKEGVSECLKANIALAKMDLTSLKPGKAAKLFVQDPEGAGGLKEASLPLAAFYLPAAVVVWLLF